MVIEIIFTQEAGTEARPTAVPKSISGAAVSGRQENKTP
jgi:hypothetical protein